MPGTYSQLLLHVVFSTKSRAPWITQDIAGRLYPYIGGIVRAEKGVLYDIGGVENHLHMYLRCRPRRTAADRADPSRVPDILSSHARRPPAKQAKSRSAVLQRRTCRPLMNTPE